MRSAELRLHAGGSVGIVGGGPAGSFYALHLLRFARQESLPLQVTILERKDFGRRGQAGCNKCAGILSARLLVGLAELELQIPERVVMAQLEGYTFHIGGEEIEITQPDPAQKILSVYRGGGPLKATLPPDVSFDGWLLGQASAAGAEVVHGNVRAIVPGEQMQVRTDTGERSFDLVVLACGVNARPPALPGMAYRPPQTQVMAQDEIDQDHPAALCGVRRIQVYAGREAGLLFGALIPKGDLMNVSLLGQGLGGDAVGRFLHAIVPGPPAQDPGRRLCGCYPRIAVSAAPAAFADRFVAVGDAAVTRLYKGGITSAFLTARQAAWASLYAGISRPAFAASYGPLCRRMAFDNRVGQGLFWLWQRSQSLPSWERALASALLAEHHLPPRRRHGHLALWAVLTGDSPYTRIARHFLHPAILRAFSAALIAR